MRVIQRLNNNVVLVSKNNQKMVVMGKGIGFKVYPKDIINEKLVEHTYLLREDMGVEDVISFINNISVEVMMLCGEIIQFAKKELQTKLNDNLIVTLSDHIQFALERSDEGIELNHPLHWEIKQVYFKEYEIGKEIIKMISDKIGKKLPDAEAAFIAIHLVNAEMNMEGEKIRQETEITEIIWETINIIQYHFQIKVAQESINFSRFVTHLRYFILRQFNNQHIQKVDTILLDIVKERYEKENQCVEKLAEYFEEAHGWHITSDEKLYLILHINRIDNRI